MVNAGPHPADADEPLPGARDGSSGDALLEQWEQRIADAGDPLAALADVLGGRARQREALFQRSGEVMLGCRLGAILGAGGMGVTYAGVDAAGEPVAVKLVPGVAGGADRRFEQECRLLQSVQHPAIVRYRAHAVLPDGTGVLCMDRVAGTDLEQVLRSLAASDPGGPAAQLLDGIDGDTAARRGSPRFRRRVLRLLSHVADGLHAAHQRGVVHRDVKPANILVRDDLTPVLIDFGLARDHQIRVSFTASGAAMGTLAYMAPEQLGRDPGAVDARTDVYALGLVLYEALCGAPLRTEIADVVRGARRPFLLDARQSRTLPVDVQAILYRCLEPRPLRRYRTAAELADDLRAAAGQGDVRARRPSAVRRFARDRRRAAAAAVMAVVALVAVGFRLWPRGREVVFAANCGAEDARVVLGDGREVLLDQRVRLPLGPVTARLVGVGDAIRPADRTFVVTAGDGMQQFAFATQFRNEALPAYFARDRAIVQFMTGHCQSRMGSDVPLDRRYVDGHEVRAPWPFVEEAVLAPGPHVFRAVDGRGRTEEQSVAIGGEPTDIQLLPAVLADVDGEYRRTWSTVWSPLPADLTVAGDAVRWFGRAQVSTLGGAGLRAVRCGFVPASADRDAHLVLHVQFPEPMRTAVVFVRGGVQRGGMLHLEAGFDGESLAGWPLDEVGAPSPRREFRSTHGATGFTLRARLRAAVIGVRDEALARVLEGSLFGGHWRDEPPCFAIAADPGERARLPRAPASAPLDVRVAPRTLLDGVRILLDDAKHVVAMTRLPGPDAECDLVATVESAAGRRQVRRLAWPGGEPRVTLVPADVRARTSQHDGEQFGEWVAAVPDQDADGWWELAIGDPTNGRYGAGSVCGCVDLVRSRDASIAWSWPAAPWPSVYADDQAGTVWPVGDWDGDGRADVLVGAACAPAVDGTPKVGRLAVLDATTGLGVWQRSGTWPHEARRAVDAFVADELRPGVVLLRSGISDLTGTLPVETRFDAHLDGGRGSAVPSPALAYPCTAVLLHDATNGASSVLVLRLGGDADKFVGLERFTLGGALAELAARQPLAFARDSLGALEVLFRIGDVDGDGMTDAALLLANEPGPGVFFVSGRELRPLFWCPLADAAFARDHVAVWMPAVGTVSAQLVVATRLGGGSEQRVELRGIVQR